MLGRKNTQMGRRGGCRRGRRWGGRGFTLIELLVVIAIIALLVSMLLPSLAGARDTARDVICKSNMKQVGVAIQMYLDAQKNPVWPNLWFGTIPTADRPAELQSNANASLMPRQNMCHWFMAYALEDYIGDNARSQVYKCPRAQGATSVMEPSVRQYLEVSGRRMFLDPGDPEYSRFMVPLPPTFRRYTEYWFNDNAYFDASGRNTNRPYRTIKHPSEFVWMADAYDEVPRHGGKTRTERGNVTGNEFIKRMNTIYLLRGDMRVDAMTQLQCLTATARDRYGNLGPFYNWGGIGN